MQHLIVDAYECRNAAALDNLQPMLALAYRLLNVNSLSPERIYSHSWLPRGISLVVLIQESHLAIETWPEFCYLAVCLFTCKNTIDRKRTLDILREFAPQRLDEQFLTREHPKEYRGRQGNST